MSDNSVSEVLPVYEVPPVYEVLALRYGTHEARAAGANFLETDDHASPMPLDYYVWAIRGPSGAAAQRTIVVDTGFGAEVAARRRGRIVLTPVETILGQAGIEAATVEDVILTHMHFDHAGRLEAFPNATFHIQDAEMAFCTGRAMGHRILRATFEVGDVQAVVGHVFAGRVRFHAGVAEIAPGITLHLVGGHTGGLQVVRVATARGWIVLAADASHYWANIRNRAPFPIVADILAMMEGFEAIERLADGPDHIIPGHDPLVRARFPRAHGHPEIVRLDLPPTTPII